MTERHTRGAQAHIRWRPESGSLEPLRPTNHPAGADLVAWRPVRNGMPDVALYVWRRGDKDRDALVEAELAAVRARLARP